VDLCLQFIKYDPNYAGDDEEEDMDVEDEEQEDDEEGGSEDYSDDDDMSWKVRRSATKCLSAVIVTRPELLQDIYKKVCNLCSLARRALFSDNLS
jgi:cullin-associated NEDD8-dissociated protein 1